MTAGLRSSSRPAGPRDPTGRRDRVVSPNAIFRFAHLIDELYDLVKRELAQQIAAIDKELKQLGVEPDEFELRRLKQRAPSRTSRNQQRHPERHGAAFGSPTPLLIRECLRLPVSVEHLFGTAGNLVVFIRRIELRHGRRSSAALLCGGRRVSGACAERGLWS